MNTDPDTMQNTPPGSADTISVPVALFRELIELADIGLMEATAALDMGIQPSVKAVTLHTALALLQEHRQKYHESAKGSE